MTTLTVVLTHVDAATVDEQLGLLAQIAPGARFAVCHGGARDQFEAIAHPDTAFVDDPTLRGAPRSFQSYHVTFATIWERWVAQDPSITAVYLIEYDHLVLCGDFAARLAEVAARTGAGFLGKNAFVRNATNWEHYGRFRRDPALRAHLRRHSVREDPTRMYGTLGDGMWLSREALAGYVAVPEHPPCYGELYVPTLLHHLGHAVVDLDAESDLYAHVRWDPPYGAGEVEALQAAGVAFVHPVKDLAVWRRAAQSASELSPRG
jgi:hypothetical protein